MCEISKQRPSYTSINCQQLYEIKILCNIEIPEKMLINKLCVLYIVEKVEFIKYSYTSLRELSVLTKASATTTEVFG